MEVESNVTAPLRAIRRPTVATPVVAVIEMLAITVPAKCVVVPNVAEEPHGFTTRSGAGG